MKTRLEHVGLWVSDLDRVTAFYENYFGARIGALYENPRKGFESRFLEFTGGARLEVMRRIDVTARGGDNQLGLAHVALCVGDEAAVDALAARLVADGRPPVSPHNSCLWRHDPAAAMCLPAHRPGAPNGKR